ncbi:CYFA0S12e03950g1_1 [Cyberlindnera fabianii]|uniref:Sphingoid long-chain base transporter RSB1 n=1 Tax=Cyberlindnera fabianii TaxID=36022 RepID=A0A061B7A6_CYBFA|nr:CYFA0S12e03950g1_1 [Cyberlindnera fabianii]
MTSLQLELASLTSVMTTDTGAESLVSLVNNLYGNTPSFGGNLAMTIIMSILFFIHTGIGLFFQTWWFSISYCLGTASEIAGYIGRLLGSHDTQNSNYFLLQIITLTIAPCFIMAGIYFLLSQVIMVYGTQFSLLKPKRYSQIFIMCDILSLLIQAIGGAMGSNALKHFKSPKNGTHVMVAGLVLQVVSMTIFLVLFLHFLIRVKYFGSSSMSEYKYKHIRDTRLFKMWPLVILIGVIFVYIRCIYRCVELGEGWNGYLITHEIYFMLFDAMMMSLTCLIFIPFHPGFVFGFNESEDEKSI